jgi:putative ABC transport system permease protein
VSAPVSNTPRDVAMRRTDVPHTSMLLRMMLRAAVLRRGRAVSALLAMVVAAAATTALLNLYVDTQSKLQREFRNYGANIVLVSKDGASLPAGTLSQVDSVLAGRGIAAAFGMIVARTGSDQPIVVVGTDFNRVRQLDKWWSVSNWPSAPQQALIGIRAVPIVTPKNQPFDLTFHGRFLHATPAGTVQTGAAEDSRIYLSLSDFVAWTGMEPSTVEVAANGSPEEITAVMNQLVQAIPAADVRPVRQIVEGETRVLGKMQATLLATAALIILTAALCVLSTLLGWVFDRRRDFAILKALGASDRLLNGFFAAEAAALGASGAVIGFAIGVGIAVWIGRVNFHAPVTPRLSVLPFVLAGSIIIALLSAIIPISLLGQIQPAAILRGE